MSVPSDKVKINYNLIAYNKLKSLYKFGDYFFSATLSLMHYNPV